MNMLPGNETPFSHIVIVSGLPRSGTSMMMRMLEAGGMTVHTDNMRKADESNPQGYFEFERTKTLRYDSSWLKDVRGKAVKIVSPLLHDLPWDRGYSYRIVFMERDLDEVLASQSEMNRRLHAQEETDPSALRESYRKHLQVLGDWLAQKRHVEVLPVEYAMVIMNPLQEARRVSAFLGCTMDIHAMAQVVDASLYRQRLKGSDRTELQPSAGEKDIIEEQLRRLGYL